MPASARVGKNEALFREVNEKIRDVSAGFGTTDPVEFICECSRPECAATIPLTLDQYEAVRSDPTHFVVMAGHVWDADSEHVVAKNGGHWVVEKDGIAGVVAEAAAD
ncbi:MAG TPA: hypothetical protein VH306_01140 [Gaiellaceae bacterium]